MKRTVGGWALIVLGCAGALVGLAMAILLGPDGRRTTGPHPVPVEGSVLVTGPKALDWVDVRVDILAEVPASKPVFVGMASTVDVDDYVKGVQHVEISRFSTPWQPELRDVAGEQLTVRGAPTALDWWLAESAGLGGANLSVTLPDEPVSLAVVAIGSSNLSGLNITLAYGIKGGFYKGIGLLLVGAGAMLAGRMVLRGDHALEEGFAPDADDQVVYVLVDEDGVEHVLSEAEVEAGEFDVVTEEVVVVESAPDPSTDDGEAPDVSVLEGPDVSGQPDPVAFAGPGTVVEDVVVEDTGGQDAASAGGEEPSGGTEAIYVWIDDDGVEHELTEAELAELGDDFEIVDDPEDDR